jgi:hypothetical protein
LNLSGFCIESTATFDKAVKKLKKRFKKIEFDYNSFVNNITSTDDLGIHLGDNVYKIRLKNSDKQSGKSGGYRIITYLQVIDEKVYMVYIYDKSDIENLSENEIDSLVLELAREVQ